ncbi:MAG: caspase family protein [Saprospirales bacterium]|nr:caspase family protein [Saprospirales bacterium]
MKSFLLKTPILLFAVFLCFPFSLCAQTDSRLALVIGNKDYYETDMTLNNPINDANAMESVLRECNFKVIKVVNGTKEAIEKAVESFTESLENYDVGLFYYSGHGVEIISKGNRMNFIVPVNVSSQITEVDVEYKCVSSEWIQAKMAEAGAYSKTNILIFDACRDNPFRKLKRSLKLEDEVWSPPAKIPTGVITCFSASPNESSSDGSGKNGLYTSILLRHIRTPNILVEEVFKRVRIEIISLGGQEPQEVTKLTTSFYFRLTGDVPIPKPVEDKNAQLAREALNRLKHQPPTKDLIRDALLSFKFDDAGTGNTSSEESKRMLTHLDAIEMNENYGCYSCYMAKLQSGYYVAIWADTYTKGHYGIRFGTLINNGFPFVGSNDSYLEIRKP